MSHLPKYTYIAFLMKIHNDTVLNLHNIKLRIHLTNRVEPLRKYSERIIIYVCRIRDTEILLVMHTSLYFS